MKQFKFLFYVIFCNVDLHLFLLKKTSIKKRSNNSIRHKIFYCKTQAKFGINFGGKFAYISPVFS